MFWGFQQYEKVQGRWKGLLMWNNPFFFRFAGGCDVMETFYALPVWKCRQKSSLFSLLSTQKRTDVRQRPISRWDSCWSAAAEAPEQRRWWRVCKQKNTPKTEKEWYLHSDDNTIFPGWRDENIRQPPAVQAEARRIDSEDDTVERHVCSDSDLILWRSIVK